MNTRVCVVTGASRGIGLATALRFARAGYAIVATARGADELGEARAQIEATGAACETVTADIGRPESASRVIDAAVRRFGRVDVLVNNAGFAVLRPIDQTEPADFDTSLAVNVGAVFHAARAVWPVMKRQGGGVIVNVSSLASVDPFPGFSVYGACKAWVNLFSQALAAEGKASGIRVYAVAPGAVETGMMRGAFPDFPPERALAPDEVAVVIEAVCHEPLSHVSGQTIFVRK